MFACLLDWSGGGHFRIAPTCPYTVSRRYLPAMGRARRRLSSMRHANRVDTSPSALEGEGFPVHRAFAGVDLATLDPFVHMDQMREVDYAPGEPKGTPWHPYRGFETVTYMLDGIFQHQDSNGGGGLITDGDTQWVTAGPEVFVVLDTNVFLEHPQKLEELDLAPIVGVRGEPIHVLVPIVVIDELDGLKQHGDRKVRWRAGYTLAVLDRVLPRPTAVARLRDGDFSALSSGGIPRGEVSVEVLFDPPGHVRLPINDDKIIDRALAVEPLAARYVTLVTYDTGQCMRARAAGLHAKKLSKPLGEEPE